MKFSHHSLIESAGTSLKRLGLATLILFMATSFAVAQEAAPESSKKESEIEVRSVLVAGPKGYGPAELPEKNGVLMIAEKKPAGLFYAYTNEGNTATDLISGLKAMVASMFADDPKAPVEWSSSQLPARAQFPNEVRTMWTAAQGNKEIQLTIYSHSLAAQEVACGYFAMRHKDGKGDNGKFLDGSGKGVKEFDKFCSGFDPIK